MCHCDAKVQTIFMPNKFFRVFLTQIFAVRTKSPIFDVWKSRQSAFGAIFKSGYFAVECRSLPHVGLILFFHKSVMRPGRSRWTFLSILTLQRFARIVFISDLCKEPLQIMNAVCSQLTTRTYENRKQHTHCRMHGL